MYEDKTQMINQKRYTRLKQNMFREYDCMEAVGCVKSAA